MDPVTGAVVAIVLFFGSIPIAGLILVPLVGFLFGLIDDELITVGAFFGVLATVGWGLFALVQGILQIIHLVQLLTASA